MITASDNVVHDDSLFLTGHAINTNSDIPQSRDATITSSNNKITNGSHCAVGYYDLNAMAAIIRLKNEDRHRRGVPLSNNPSQNDYPVSSNSNIAVTGHRVMNDRHVQVGVFETARTDRSYAQSVYSRRNDPGEAWPEGTTQRNTGSSYHTSYGGDIETELSDSVRDTGVSENRNRTTAQYWQWSRSPEQRYHHRQRQVTYNEPMQGSLQYDDTQYDSGARQTVWSGRRRELEY